jgi:hypothetical protein
MLITLVYLCVDENIFHDFFIFCLIMCIYIFKNMFINSFIYYIINY